VVVSRRAKPGDRPDAAQQKFAPSTGIGSWFEPSTKNPADLEDLTEALQQLPLEIREIIVSKIWGNLTFREISELTGRPISSVHHDYQTGITQLRDILTDEF